jgi:hypothetical protein
MRVLVRVVFFGVHVVTSGGIILSKFDITDDLIVRKSKPLLSSNK